MSAIASLIPKSYVCISCGEEAAPSTDACGLCGGKVAGKQADANQVILAILELAERVGVLENEMRRVRTPMLAKPPRRRRPTRKQLLRT